MDTDPRSQRLHSLLREANIERGSDESDHDTEVEAGNWDMREDSGRDGSECLSSQESDASPREQPEFENPKVGDELGGDGGDEGRDDDGSAALAAAVQAVLLCPASVLARNAEKSSSPSMASLLSLQHRCPSAEDQMLSLMLPEAGRGASRAAGRLSDEDRDAAAVAEAVAAALAWNAPSPHLSCVEEESGLSAEESAATDLGSAGFAMHAALARQPVATPFRPRHERTSSSSISRRRGGKSERTPDSDGNVDSGGRHWQIEHPTNPTLHTNVRNTNGKLDHAVNPKELVPQHFPDADPGDDAAMSGEDCSEDSHSGGGSDTLPPSSLASSSASETLCVHGTGNTEIAAPTGLVEAVEDEDGTGDGESTPTRRRLSSKSRRSSSMKVAALAQHFSSDADCGPHEEIGLLAVRDGRIASNDRRSDSEENPQRRDGTVVGVCPWRWEAMGGGSDSISPSRMAPAETTGPAQRIAALPNHDLAQLAEIDEASDHDVNCGEQEGVAAGHGVETGAQELSRIDRYSSCSSASASTCVWKALVRVGAGVEGDACDTTPGKASRPHRFQRLTGMGRVWPSGVDPAKREEWLAPAEFQAVFAMPFREFQALPSWRKVILKQRVQLF